MSFYVFQTLVVRFIVLIAAMDISFNKCAYVNLLVLVGCGESAR
jgi:hypothetical protein